MVLDGEKLFQRSACCITLDDIGCIGDHIETFLLHLSVGCAAMLAPKLGPPNRYTSVVPSRWVLLLHHGACKMPHWTGTDPSYMITEIEVEVDYEKLEHKHRMSDAGVPCAMFVGWSCFNY